MKNHEHGNKKIKQLYEKIQPAASALLSAWRQTYGETRQVTFNNILIAYQKDPRCKAFLDFLADQAVGAGFDAKKANCRLNWDTEKPQTKLDDIIRIDQISTNLQTAYICPEEVRKIGQSRF